VVAACALCRAEVEPGAGTLLTAGPRKLGLVHHDCANVAQRGVAFFGRLAIYGLGKVVQARAPALLATFRATQALLQQRKSP